MKKLFDENMDNYKHFGTRYIFLHAQEGLFDSFKNISYEISWNFLIFGNSKRDLWKNKDEIWSKLSP